MGGGDDKGSIRPKKGGGVDEDSDSLEVFGSSHFQQENWNDAIRGDGDLSINYHNVSQNKVKSMTLGVKANSGSIENVHELEEVTAHALNAPYTFNVSNVLFGNVESEATKTPFERKESTTNENNFEGALLELKERLGTGTGSEGGVGPSVIGYSHVTGQKDKGLLSFDKACDNLKALKNKKKKHLKDLGWNVDSSRSYFDCIAPRQRGRSKNDVKGDKNDVYLKNKISPSESKGTNPTHSGESISFNSLTDSEV